MKHIFYLLTLISFFINTAHSVEAPRIPYVQIVDSINMGVQLRLERALETAREWKAPAIFVELDTPGGYLEVTRQIVQKFLESEDILIIVHVSPQGARAASAGAMITFASHYASMAPSTSIGAATPVAGGGKEIEGDMKNKITNDTVAFVEGIAEKRGRNKVFAKESVTLASSLTSSDALKQNVIDGVFENRNEVWKGARKKFNQLPEQISFVSLEMNLKEKTMSLLSNPNVAMGLMALGTLGIYMEMNSPGLVIPGLIGVTSLALGAFSTQIIPIQSGALVLLAIGIVFLAIELLTAWPTFGVAGAASLVMFFMSGLFLLDGQEADFGLDPIIWLPVFIVLMVSVGFLSYSAMKALKTKAYSSQGSTGMIGLVGQISHIQTKNVSVSVMGEIWRANCDTTFEQSLLKLGDKVEVVGQEGLTLRIRKIEGA